MTEASWCKNPVRLSLLVILDIELLLPILPARVLMTDTHRSTFL